MATWIESPSPTQTLIDSLSPILDSFPESIISSDDPASSLLHNKFVFNQVTRRLRLTKSGSGSDDVCRWIYDTFKSNFSNMQLVIISYIPTMTGVYLSRSISSKETLAGFEAILLALYTHEMGNRGAQPQSVRFPNVRISGAIDANKASGKGKGVATEPDLTEAIISPTVRPYHTMRSTRRSRIVGVVLDLYYSKISLMPILSKIEFCKVCIAWAGKGGLLMDETGEDEEKKEEQDKEEEKPAIVPLTWELYVPLLKILGHCLMGPTNSAELKDIGLKAVKCIYLRAMKEFNSKAILASRSLVRLGQSIEEPIPEPTFSGSIDNIFELEAMKSTILSS